MLSRYTLPEPSSAFRTEVTLIEKADSLCVRYDYYRYEQGRLAGIFRSGLYFQGVESYRHLKDRNCTFWHAGAFDSLVEIEDSEWIDALKQMSSMDEELDLHHYMIYVKGSGCYEVVAQYWDALPEEEGTWEPLSAEEEEAWNLILQS